MQNTLLFIRPLWENTFIQLYISGHTHTSQTFLYLKHWSLINIHEVDVIDIQLKFYVNDVMHT